METAGLVDQLLNVHRNRYRFREAACLRAQALAAFAIRAASDSRVWISSRQATTASLKTGLAILSSKVVGTVTLWWPPKSSEFRAILWLLLDYEQIWCPRLAHAELARARIVCGRI
jgi:hypothetical protein